jgi:hypothetical protein
MGMLKTIQLKNNIDTTNIYSSTIKENTVLVANKFLRNLKPLSVTNRKNSFEILRNDNKDLCLLGK